MRAEKRKSKKGGATKGNQNKGGALTNESDHKASPDVFAPTAACLVTVDWITSCIALENTSAPKQVFSAKVLTCALLSLSPPPLCVSAHAFDKCIT